jgi:hypothetical protein
MPLAACGIPAGFISSWRVMGENGLPERGDNEDLTSGPFWLTSRVSISILATLHFPLFSRPSGTCGNFCRWSQA